MHLIDKKMVIKNLKKKLHRPKQERSIFSTIALIYQILVPS